MEIQIMSTVLQMLMPRTSSLQTRTRGEYSDVSIFKLDDWEFVNAHGFDSNRPQLIYDLFFKGTIKPIK